MILPEFEDLIKAKVIHVVTVLTYESGPMVTQATYNFESSQDATLLFNALKSEYEADDDVQIVLNKSALYEIKG